MIDKNKVKTRKKRKSGAKIFAVLVLVTIAAAVTMTLIPQSEDTEQYKTYGKDEIKPGLSRVKELSKYKADKDGLYVKIEKGWGLSQIAVQLADIGIIANKDMFVKIADFYEFSTRFPAGSYYLRWDMSYLEMMQTLMDKPKTITVYIPEHYDFNKMVNKLTEEGVIKKKKAFVNFAQNARLGYDFEADIPDDRKPRYEGYCFPATYNFDPFDNNEMILRKMFDAFELRFTDSMRKKANKMNFSVDEVLTLASIVQREGLHIEEFPRIAGVFINRLKNNMRFGSCATVQYIFENDDDPDTVHNTGVLTQSQISVDNPYNTYKYEGLPPGPICSPGMEAVKAVLNYEKHDYMYFLAKGDGWNDFQKTYADHLKAKEKYL